MSQWSISRINRLLKLTEDDHYLEIGVQKGNTFFGIDAGFKVAVDPKFLFDLQARSNSDEMFFQVTSDDFFASEVWGANSSNTANESGVHLQEMIDAIQWL